MDSIPEWKRGALVLVENDKEDEEVQGLFGKIKGKLGEKFKDSSVGKQFLESEEAKRLKKLRAEINEFKADLKD